MNRCALVAVAGLVSFAFMAEPKENPVEDTVIHGTINIVLANQNSFVIVTDSMQTQQTPSGERQIAEPAQKLFLLDDRSVCTVAGFGSATVSSAPEFNLQTAGVIQDYKSQLARQGAPVGFPAKLTSMSFIFNFYLSSIANLMEVMRVQGSYSFQLILAGYDTDGTPKLGVLSLRPVVSTGPSGQPTISVATETIKEWPVRKELTYLVSGQGDVAAAILGNPAHFIDEPSVRRYAESMAADSGSSLSIEEMKQLAKFIVHRTANRHPSVGGEIQIAVLQGGRIVGIEQRIFAQAPTPLHFNLSTGSHFEGHAISVSNSVFLWIRNQFIDDPALSIDGHYFFENQIVRCRVLYDGGFARLDPSNRIRDSVLVIGQHADSKSDFVQRLVHDFPWREVVYEKK